MICRAATLALAGVIALGAANATPLSRSQTNPEICRIIWQVASVQQQRVSAQAEPDYSFRRAETSSPFEPHAPIRFFFASLYQRPPPTL